MTTKTPAANANGYRRRQVVAQVLAEETHCHICTLPVDKTLTYQWGQHGPRCKGDGCPGCVPHPMRAEVDEVVPRSRGGSATERSNCRLSHRDCNRRKGDGTDAAPATVGYGADAFALSGCWGSLLNGLTLT